MKKVKRSVFILLLLCSLVLLVWWTLYTPYNPGKVFAPLPDSTAFVSVHTQLASRWKDITVNPVTRSIFLSMGVESDDLDESYNDPIFKKWAMMLADKKTVFAYVPSLGFKNYRRQPGWIGTSWIGGRSQRLRWQLELGLMKDFKKIGTYRGRPIWLVTSADLDDDEPLTITFVEGMLIACICQDLSAIERVLDTYDGLRPRLTVPKNMARQQRTEENNDGYDQGWVNLRAIRLPMIKRDVDDIEYQLDTVTPFQLAGFIMMNQPPLAFNPVESLKDEPDISSLLRDIPFAASIMSADMASYLLTHPACPYSCQVAGQLMHEQKAETVIMALAGDDYSSRLKGFKVPSLFICIKLGEEHSAYAAANKYLDLINARYHQGLIPVVINNGPHSIFTLESTTDKLFSKLSSGERPAFTMVGDWMVIGNSSDALIKLLQNKTDHTDMTSYRWYKQISNHQTPAALWLDLTSGTKAARLVISTYSLKLLFEDPDGSQRTRQQLNELKAWLETIQPMNNLSLWLQPDDDATRLYFDFGDPDMTDSDILSQRR